MSELVVPTGVLLGGVRAVSTHQHNTKGHENECSNFEMNQMMTDSSDKKS